MFNKEQKKEWSRKYYIKNKERITKRNREYEIKHKKGYKDRYINTIFNKKHRTKHSQGYWLVWIKDHQYKNNSGYVPEHRLVMEKRIGRYINPKVEDVHHIDKDRKNNDIDNLLLCSRIEHIRIHKGWYKIKDFWFKVCKGCNRELEVSTNNFYLRSKGGYVHICKRCIKLSDTRKSHKRTCLSKRTRM